MPFGPTEWPHLGLGLLKAGLNRLGIECEVEYFTLDFAHRIGISNYISISSEVWSYFTQVGEWMFMPVIHNTDTHDQDSYWKWLHSLMPSFFSEEFLTELKTIQYQTEEFIDDCIQQIDWQAFDIIGFSTSHQQNNASLAMAKRIKQTYPDKAIVFGGYNTYGEMGIGMLEAFDFVDYACLGEGDVLFPEFLRRYQLGQSVKSLPGWAFRENGRVSVSDEQAISLPILDDLPYPDYDDYFDRRSQLFIESEWGGYIPFETSRGCWWGERKTCAFCAHNAGTMSYRKKDFNRAYQELEYLVERYNPHYISAMDAVAPKQIDELLTKIREGGKSIRLIYELRATITKDLLDSMQRTGVDNILIGIESFSTPILRQMHKGTTMLLNIQALKWCRELGITVDYNIISGFPEEDPAEYLHMTETLPLLTHLQPPSSWGKLRLYRFSPHFRDPAKYGLKDIRPAKSYRYVYPELSEDQINRLACQFEYDYEDDRDPAQYTVSTWKVIEAWREIAPKAFCAFVDDGERLRLFDTRPIAGQITRVITDLDRDLFLACDGQQKLQSLVQRFGRDGISADAIRARLDWMVDEHLMLCEMDAYISLAVDIGRYILPERRAIVGNEVCLALAQTLTQHYYSSSF